MGRTIGPSATPSAAFLEARATWNDISLAVQSIHFPPFAQPTRKEPQFTRMHYHEYIELIYMVGGELLSKVGTQVYTLAAGDLLMIRSNTPHTFDCPYQREYICIKFQPELLYGDDQSLIPLRYQLPLLFDDNGGCRFDAGSIRGIDLDGLFRSLVEEGEEKRFGFQMIMRGELLKLFGWILRCTDDATPDREILPQTEKLIRKAIEYVEQHLQTVTLEETASACGMSYSYFSRLFRKVLHKSFSQYVSSLRIEAAARMLGESDLSVEEIGYRVGFGSASYFISRFREIKGLSPHQFRKAMLVSERGS